MVSRNRRFTAPCASTRPKALPWADYGRTKSLPTAEMERYCELVAAIKVRTSNKQGGCLSTAEATRLLEEHGMRTPVSSSRDADS